MNEPSRGFQTTHWSVVLTAAESGTPEAAEALETLCASYWYPLYAFLRQKGHPPAEAEDLTQEFFARRIVNRRLLQRLTPDSGRFRSWLLAALRNFAINEWEKSRAMRRGGGAPHQPLDFGSSEARFLREAGSARTPELEYDRAWALDLIDRTLAQLRNEFERGGQREEFEALRRFLPGAEPADPAYDEIAGRLGKTPGAIKMAVSRLRREFGRRLRAVIAETVATPAEVDDEVRHLLEVLRQG